MCPSRSLTKLVLLATAVAPAHFLSVAEALKLKALFTPRTSCRRSTKDVVFDERIRQRAEEIKIFLQGFKNQKAVRNVAYVVLTCDAVEELPELKEYVTVRLMAKDPCFRKYIDLKKHVLENDDLKRNFSGFVSQDGYADYHYSNGKQASEAYLVFQEALTLWEAREFTQYSALSNKALPIWGDAISTPNRAGREPAPDLVMRMLNNYKYSPMFTNFLRDIRNRYDLNTGLAI